MTAFGKLHDSIRTELCTQQVIFKVHDHAQLPSPIRNPGDFAAALGYPLERITKSLFLCSRDRRIHAVAVCSAERRLDYSSVAAALGVRRIEAATLVELQVKTGYSPNGVSPLGLSDDIAVLVDVSLMDHPTVLIGGGAAALEVELAPTDLVRISGAMVTHITNEGRL